MLITLDAEKLDEILFVVNDGGAFRKQIYEAAVKVRRRVSEDDRLEWRIAECPTCEGAIELVDGASLRAIRKAAGMTLAQVGKVAGVTPQFLSDVESNRRTARRRIIQAYLLL